MKKISKIVMAFFLCFSLWACSNQELFKEEEITMEAIQEKIENDESFVMIVERENCGFCESIQEYIEETKQEHPGIVLYKLDTTNFGFYTNPEPAKTLSANTDQGKAFLQLAPYFYYTPTIYRFEKGKIVEVAVGFSDATKEVSVGGLDEPIDFDQAQTQDFWEFISK